MTPWLFIAALYSLTTLQPVTISIYPRVDAAPAAFRARAIIEKHADNRLLVMEVDGPEYKSSQFQIDGAQRQRVFEWTRLELHGVGEYIATATLVRITEGKTRKLVSTQVFHVSGFDPYELPMW